MFKMYDKKLKIFIFIIFCIIETKALAKNYTVGDTIAENNYWKIKYIQKIELQDGYNFVRYGLLVSQRIDTKKFETKFIFWNSGVDLDIFQGKKPNIIHIDHKKKMVIVYWKAGLNTLRFHVINPSAINSKQALVYQGLSEGEVTYKISKKGQTCLKYRLYQSYFKNHCIEH